MIGYLLRSNSARQLARDGRKLGANRTGLEWLMPTPVEVTRGRRGPVGVAGRVGVTGYSGPDL